MIDFDVLKIRWKAFWCGHHELARWDIDKRTQKANEWLCCDCGEIFDREGNHISNLREERVIRMKSRQ